MIPSPQFIELISTPQLYQRIMEGLFTHFFPDSALTYNQEDIKFFIAFTNGQKALRILINPLHSDQPQNLFNLSKFKSCLDRILCKGWNEGGAAADPLEFYKSDVSSNFA